MSVYKQDLKKHIYITLIGLLLMMNYSCNFIQKNEKIDILGGEITGSRVALNEKEAKLLVNVSTLNLKVLSLSKILQEKSDDYSIKALAITFENEHKKIKNILSEVGNSKLISLPDSLIKNNFKNINKNEDEFSSKKYFEEISKLLKSEITQLEYLTTITDDVDFKVMAARILVRLGLNQSELNKIK